MICVRTVRVCATFSLSLYFIVGQCHSVSAYMCATVYASMSVCACVCDCVCACVNVSASVTVFVCVCMCVCVCVCVFVFVCLNVFVRV